MVTRKRRHKDDDEGHNPHEGEKRQRLDQGTSGVASQIHGVGEWI